jgi:hypothetical protein
LCCQRYSSARSMPNSRASACTSGAVSSRAKAASLNSRVCCRCHRRATVPLLEQCGSFQCLSLGVHSILVHIAESGDSVPRRGESKMRHISAIGVPPAAAGGQASIRCANPLLGSNGRETHAGSQGTIDPALG